MPSLESRPAFLDRRKSLRPRPYQEEAVQSVLQGFDHEDFCLVQAATGAGKTIIFSLVIQRWLKAHPGTRIAVLAHRRELVAQARDKLRKVIPDLDPGIACSSLERKRNLDTPVTIGTIQTLARCALHQPFDLIIIDEVHRLPTRNRRSQFGTFLDQMRDLKATLKVLGVTATPFRLGHGNIYGSRCPNPGANWFPKRHYHINIDTLQEEGFLSPFTTMVAADQLQEDLRSCALDSFGEYDAKDLEKAVIKREHLNSAVQTLMAHAQDRRSIVIFCVSIPHADRLVEALQEEGILAASVHSEQDLKEREHTLEAFNRGEVRILTNVGVLTEGWDAPRADCVMLCRPTLSPALYVQMVDRGLRTFPGKRDCLVLDLVGNYERHGSVRAPRVQVPGLPEEPTQRKTQDDRTCPHCKEVIALRSLTCPHCQSELGPAVVRVDEELPLVRVEEEDQHLISCDGCQTDYRHDELELELLSDDLDSFPLGIWYCPEGHPIKATEPPRAVEASGEYQLWA